MHGFDPDVKEEELGDQLAPAVSLDFRPRPSRVRAKFMTALSEDEMAKPVTQKIKLVSTRRHWLLLRDQEESAQSDREARLQEIRSGRAQARRIQGSQNQIADWP